MERTGHNSQEGIWSLQSASEKRKAGRTGEKTERRVHRPWTEGKVLISLDSEKGLPITAPTSVSTEVLKRLNSSSTALSNVSTHFRKKKDLSCLGVYGKITVSSLRLYY